MDKILILFLFIIFSCITNFSVAQPPGPNKSQMNDQMKSTSSMTAPMPMDNPEMDKMDHDMMMMGSKMMVKHLLMMSMKMRMMGKMMSMSNDPDMANKGRNMMSMSMQLYTMARELMREYNMSPRDMSEPMMND